MALKRMYPALDKTQIHVERRVWTAEEENRIALADQYLAQYNAESLLQVVLDSAEIEEFKKRMKAAL